MGGDTDSSKCHLRRELTARRRALDANAVARASEQACGRIASKAAFRVARHVVLYAPRSLETDPSRLELEARYAGAPTYYPAVEGDRLLFRQATARDLAPGHHRVLEPPKRSPALPCDATGVVIVVPGLAFDRRGGRLGSGLGYYDRTLGAFVGAVRFGLTLDAFLIERLPLDRWDEPMHLVATEGHLLDFQGTVIGHPGDSPWTT